jgi:hypothetical protein
VVLSVIVESLDITPLPKIGMGCRRMKPSDHFACLFVVILETVIEEWRNSYNTTRPHSSLNWKTPAAYAATWRQN